MKKIVFIILIIFLVIPALGEAKEKDNLRSVFREIYEKSSWPVEGTDFDDIISPFGPRYYSSNENNFDWHRGLDIGADEGADVLSVKKGIFWEYDNYTGAGNTVIIRYEFPETTRFQGKELQYYYAYYMHLSDVPKKN
ncbi:MAG: M23 family metallopeptidase [Patescibacteria group bacterium]